MNFQTGDHFVDFEQFKIESHFADFGEVKIYSMCLFQPTLGKSQLSH